jgi:predicted DNA-binding transcriptional regulator YafY
VPRSAEIVRQWEVLRALEASRVGETIRSLAAKRGVSTRTIRRDLQALEQAGFPLYDDRSGGATRWKLSAKPFHTLTGSGFTASELAALYFSRTLVECLAGTPFRTDLETAFAKLEAAMSPTIRKFIDRLPNVLVAKAEPSRKRLDPRQRKVISGLLEAMLHQRRVRMRYDSASSRRQKDYIVDPYRLVHAQGGLYLMAHVPEYGQLRTFALERVRTLHLLDVRFEPVESVSADAFPHSLGVNTGPPERITIRFAGDAARYVREREWHESQKLDEQQDGSLVLSLDVCNDAALRAWILSFGAMAHVVGPERLATQVRDEIERARLQYAEQR